MFNVKLKGQLLIPILCAVMIGVLGLLGFGNWKTSQIVEGIIIDSISRDQVAATRAVNDWVENMSANLANWSHDKRLVAALEGDQEAMASITDFTATILQDFPWYEAVALVKPDGQVLAASPASYATLNVSDRQYFQAAMRGEKGKSKPLTSRATGNHIYIMSIPIKGKTGSILGVLFVVVKLDSLYTNILAPIKIGDNGYAFMVDSTGRVLGHPDPKQMMENVANTDFCKEMLSRKTGIYAYYSKLYDQQKYMAFGEVKGTGWIVSVTAPLGDLMASLRVI